MSPDQHRAYRGKRGLWANACRVQGWDPEDEAKRREITLQAARKINPTSTCNSTANLNEGQITALFKLLIHLADPLNVEKAVAASNPKETAQADLCRRLVWKIRQIAAGAGLNDAYIQTIANWDCREAAVSAWDRLPEPGLRRVLVHLNQRANEKNPRVTPRGPHRPKVKHDATEYEIKPRSNYQPKPSRAHAEVESENPF